MNRLFKIVLGALLVLGGPNLSRADDVECSDGKVKTCFMDGNNPSCVCLEPASSTEEVAPQGPNPGDEDLEYQGNGMEDDNEGDGADGEG